MEAIYKEVIFENFTWIDIYNPGRTNLDKIATDFKLDYYQILDSLEPGHLPKLEHTDEYKFLILRAFSAELTARITTISELSDKIAFFYNDKQLITIHRAQFDFLDAGRRTFNDSEKLLIDIIKRVFETFDKPIELLSHEMDDFERTIFLSDSKKISMEDLYFQKAQLRTSKNLLHLTQNVLNQMEVKKSSKSALQDAKDKLLGLMMGYDEELEKSNHLLNTYISVNEQKNNDVVKLLTIFSAFFLPLTFIAGMYGMNFKNMPELETQYGYFFTIGFMAVISIVIYLWFRRRRIL